MKTRISDLPGDLVAEILFRVPLTCLKAIRFTCKKWNALSKTQVLCKARKQFLALMKSTLCSTTFDLQGILNNGEDFVDPDVKEISVFNQVKISDVYHCDGLLLCVNEDHSSLLIWNPYLGQTRWIQPINYKDRNYFYHDDVFTLGYDKNNRNHKILRILNGLYNARSYEIYDLSSNSWRILDVNFECHTAFYRNLGSLRGNTYFLARTNQEDWVERLLLCFDFTAERFGPRLSLPCGNFSFQVLVKDEQLALLYEDLDIIDMKIWITNKIERDEVSWRKFLKVDKEKFAGVPDEFEAHWFFIDEEKKAAVIFGYKTACIVGADGYFKSVNIKEKTRNLYVISSYVPSLVQLRTNQQITN